MWEAEEKRRVRVKENNRQKECGRGVLMVTFKAKEMTEGGGTD